MPAIAELYATVLPETSKIAEGITAAFRKVDPEAREAGRRWGREIQQGLGEAKVELKADTTKAKAEIDEAAKDKKATVEVNADTAKARIEIDAVARDRKANIRVDADTLVSSVERGFSQMAPAFAGAGTQLSTSLASGGASAASSVGGSLSSAMGPVGSALTVALVGAGVAAAAGIAGALSGAIGLIPAGLGGGIAVLGTLVTGLDGVKDAWDAAGKAADSATKDQAEKAKAVASAQKTLRDAVLDEATAQRDVSNARKDARVQLEDLNVQLRGGVIDEKSAILDAQAARRDLATGRFKDSIEYQQAQLRVQQADQRVLESHERNVQLQDKATDANAKGVSQSDQVVAANQRLAKAHDDVATAQSNLASTQTKPSSEAEALAIAMGKLSPTAQAFIGTLTALKPAWQSLKFSVQDSLFAGIGPQLQSLATQYLPVLKTAMTGLAGTMNSAFKDVGAWLSKPETLSTIQQIVANIGASFQVWSKSLVPFSQAFLTITQVGSGFLPSLGKVITDGANAFNNFIQQASKSGQLQQWMGTGIQAMGELIKMLPIVGKMFLDLAPMAIPFLQNLNLILVTVEPLFRIMGNAMAMWSQAWNTILTQAGKTLGSFGGVLENLGGTFERVWHTITKVIEKAWGTISGIFEKLKQALIHLDPTGIIGNLANLANKLFGDNTISGTPTAASSAAAPAAPSAKAVPGAGIAAAGGNAKAVPGASIAQGGAAASGFDWDAVAKAESSGNWSNADTGHNGHYGGLQFSPETWAAYGGLEFAARPDLATPEQQKMIANRTAFTGWKGTPPQGLGAWETITNGSVPGVTTSSTPSSMPSAGAAPSGVMPVPSGGAVAPTLPGASPSSAIASVGGLNLSTIPVAAQKYANDCIDASARIILSHSGINMTEDQLEGVISPGGTIDSQAAGLNKLNPAGGYQAMQGSGGSAAAMFQAIKASIDTGTGSILNVAPGSSIAGQPFSEGHFIAATGYNADGTINLSDTAKGTQYSVSAADAFQATRGRGIVAGTGSGPSATTGGVPTAISGMYPSAAGMPTIASPQGVSPEGMPLGTQQSPMYVSPAGGGSGGQQLGQDMVSGIMEMFGFDGSLFKNPMDSGLFKGFKGGMSFFTGLLGGGKGGMPGSAGGGGGMPAMGGGGDMLGGLGNMLTGIMPQPFGQTTAGGPMQAPGAFQPMLPGSGGNTGMPSNFLAPGQGEQARPGQQIDQSTTYVLNGTPPPGSMDFVNGVNVPRARQGVRGMNK